MQQGERKLTEEQVKNEARFGATYGLNNLPVSFELRVDNPKSGRLTGNGETREAVAKALQKSGKFTVNEGTYEVTLLGEGSIVGAIQEIAKNSTEIQQLGKKELAVRAQLRAEKDQREAEMEAKTKTQHNADQVMADALRAKIKASGTSGSL